jgi:hypothetical protein
MSIFTNLEEERARTFVGGFGPDAVVFIELGGNTYVAPVSQPQTPAQHVFCPSCGAHVATAYSGELAPYLCDGCAATVQAEREREAADARQREAERKQALRNIDTLLVLGFTASAREAFERLCADYTDDEENAHDR